MTQPIIVLFIYNILKHIITFNNSLNESDL